MERGYAQTALTTDDTELLQKRKLILFGKTLKSSDL